MARQPDDPILAVEFTISAGATAMRYRRQLAAHFAGSQHCTFHLLPEEDRTRFTRLKPFSACPDRRIHQHEQRTRWYGRSAELGGGGPISLLGTSKPIR
jgi:hypothetical protein